MSISLVIADDHAAIRSGLALLLGQIDDIEIVGQACDGDEAIETVARLRPDVVLMDIRMPGTDGIAATAAITRAGAAAVLVLTSFDVDDNVFDALRAGASGFLLKTAETEDIIDAIRAVSRGDAVLAPEVTRRVIARVSESATPRRPTPSPSVDLAVLTDRERGVLDCLGEGLSNAEIARALFISQTTVKTHVSHILTKLDLQSRVQAAILARESR
ncbi:response regulator [Williamsia phyllosphaerae]|uniref:DNA-binding response regulator n=1 Tax=Williamsia phyllosphaerae TaxID=885042 RepID=A0ABQ1V7W1_9NOCA|nr:response regulator transcription factor [Williamsia phyllosphaerae]GGF40852.1 DNA-binding response regulator [Williamsia phyllosphaerae]